MLRMCSRYVLPTPLPPITFKSFFLGGGVSYLQEDAEMKTKQEAPQSSHIPQFLTVFSFCFVLWQMVMDRLHAEPLGHLSGLLLTTFCLVYC